MLNRYLALFLAFGVAATVYAASAFGGGWNALLLSGGGVPASNAVAHEKNVLFVQRTLSALGVDPGRTEAYVSIGKGEGRDVSYIAGLPPERWELAMLDRLFGHGGIELGFRRHAVKDVAGSARKPEVLAALRKAAGRLSKGDTLLVYGTDHGQRNESEPDDSLLVLWGDETMSVTEFRDSLAPAGNKGRVIAAFAQCYSGAFANFIWENDGETLSSQDRCGFFATDASREAAGCTPELNEAEYDDFSTRLFSALGGRDRLGRPAASSDFDGDGQVSFSEAHAYAIGSEETIDVPLKTSEFYLARKNIPATGDFNRALATALPEERAAWDALRKRLSFGEPASTAITAGLDHVRGELEGLYDKRDELYGRVRQVEDGLRLALLEKWPFLETPFHPEFAPFVANGEAVRGYLMSDGRTSTLNSYYAEYAELADAVLATEVEEAWWLRAERLHAHLLRAAQATGAVKKDLRRLQACEAAVPGK